MQVGGSVTRNQLFAFFFFRILKILSRASGVGSPTNHPGLQAATRHGARDPLVRYLDKVNLLTLPKNLKKKNGPYTGPVILRQGEPVTHNIYAKTDTMKRKGNFRSI